MVIRLWRECRGEEKQAAVYPTDVLFQVFRVCGLWYGKQHELCLRFVCDVFKFTYVAGQNLNSLRTVMR